MNFLEKIQKTTFPNPPPQSTPEYPKQHRNKPSNYPPSKPSKKYTLVRTQTPSEKELQKN
jgi:hypothetical protein